MIGFFDGVHLGHQALLAATRAAADSAGCAAVAVTFDRPGREVLGDGTLVPTIDTLDERVERLRSLGLDHVEVLTFDREFASRSGEWFVREELLGRLGARHLVVGYDFHFGHRRAWDAAALQALAAEGGASVEVVAPLRLDGERVSSGAVRAALLAGDVEQATRLLGRAPQLRGPVARGRRLGRQIGFPTANVTLDPRKLVPRVGIYAAWTHVPGQAEPVATALSIGRRPTIDAAGAVTVEAFLLDWRGDLYEQTISVDLVAFLREEQRFPDLTSLQAQIARDVADVRSQLNHA